MKLRPRKYGTTKTNNIIGLHKIGSVILLVIIYFLITHHTQLTPNNILPNQIVILINHGVTLKNL